MNVARAWLQPAAARCLSLRVLPSPHALARTQTHTGGVREAGAAGARGGGPGGAGRAGAGQQEVARGA